MERHGDMVVATVAPEKAVHRDRGIDEGVHAAVDRMEVESL